jgi:hypothetical protein
MSFWGMLLKKQMKIPLANSVVALYVFDPSRTIQIHDS